MKKTIAIIGCGNLGTAIVKGILAKSADQFQIIATRQRVELLDPLRTIGAHTTNNNVEAVTKADIVLLAVKPYLVASVLEEIKGSLDAGKVIVSLATGISIETIQSIIGNEVPVLRAMPNTATGVGESLTCICANDKMSSAKLEDIVPLFELIGEVIVIREDLMDGATVLGACGIAYVMRFIRAMVQGGIEIGFDAVTASKIANQTVKGAAQLLIKGQTHPEQEIDKVTTPRGCTIVGLNEMEHQGFSSALIKGIITSFKKIENTTK